MLCLAKSAVSFMVYQLEFIRYIDGRADPEIVHLVNGQFRRVEEAIHQGTLLFATIESSQRAQGFRVRENGGPIVAHRFRSDL